MPNKQNLVAVIPARGGSQRVPRKNVLPFFGHPMLAYTIAAARTCGLFSRILVSTDNAEIAEVAKAYGAEVLARPPELASGRANVSDVTVNVVETLMAKGALIDSVSVLLPNCPLRRAHDIIDHYKEFVERDRESQISVVYYRGVYPQWAMHTDQAGRSAFIFGKSVLVPSEDFGRITCPTGAVWWAKPNALSRDRSFYGQNYGLMHIDENRGFDIDTPEDLDLADIIVRGLADRLGSSPLEPIDRPPFAS